jgi:hypothetical protein
MAETKKLALKQDGLGNHKPLMALTAQGEDRDHGQQAGKDDHAPLGKGRDRGNSCRTKMLMTFVEA